jgi:hypothetical protein
MKITRLLILLLTLSVTACTFQVSVGQTPTPIPTNTAALPPDTAIAIVSPTGPASPTATVEVSSPTPLVLTATQAPQPSPTLAAATSTEQTVEIFLIALEDNGKSGTLVGCGDSAVPVVVTIPQTQGVLRAALEKLLSAKQQYYGESGLYNALYQSDLQVAGVTIEQGKAIIHLTGTVMLGGTCDVPRFEAQIRQTALQFSTVSDVAVFINDVPMEDALSQK